MEINFDLPWVIFEIRKQTYAISTRLVTGIMQIPPVIHVANAPDLFLGACNVRGDVIPVLNTRKLLNCPSADKEAEETVSLLDEKKEELDRWIGLLRRSVEGGRRFPLPLDPKKSGFGKWYYEFIRKNTAISDQLKKIEPTHNEMHAIAQKIDTARGAEGVYDEGAMGLVEQAEKCCTKIEDCINGIAQGIRETLTPMIIALSFPSTRDTCMAFTVDSVKAVDEVSLIDEKGSTKCLFVSGHFCGVAHNSKLPGEILLMDDLEIVKLVKIYHDSVKAQSAKKVKDSVEKQPEKKENDESKEDTKEKPEEKSE